MKNQTQFVVAVAFIGLTVITASAQHDDRLSAWTVRVGHTSRKIQARPLAIAKGRLLLQDDTGGKQIVSLPAMPDSERKEALGRVVGSGVVVVHAKDVLGEPATVGSGFVIRRDGWILTNNHVVRGMGSLEVEFRDSSRRMAAQCLAADRDNDVAVLKVDRLPAGTHVFELAVKTPPKPGDRVWTIGHPNELKNTIGWGDVNAVRRTTDLPEFLQELVAAPKSTIWIQTDAVLEEGSSGGPLLNPLGQAVGINTFIAGRQIGFALFLAHAREAYKESLPAKPLDLPLPPDADESALDWWSRDVAVILKDFSEDANRLAESEISDPQKYAQFNELRGRYRPKLVELMHREPKSWPSLQAALLICDAMADDSEDSVQSRSDANRVLIEHHLCCPDLVFLMLKNAERFDDGTNLELCAAVLRECSDRDMVAAAQIGTAVHRLKAINRGECATLEALQAARLEVTQLADQLESASPETRDYASLLRQLLAAERGGLPAEEISGIDVAGNTFSLSEYKGQVVLLDFFVDWCPWCKRMYGHNRDLVSRYEDRPFVLLGVNADHQQVLERLVNDGTVTWRCWADGQQGPISESWNVTGYPHLVLIDHRGIVRRQFSGSPGEQDLDKAIEQLVKEAEAEKGLN